MSEFVTGMIVGACVGEVLVWLLWWWGERPRQSPSRWAAHADEVQQMHAADQALADPLWRDAGNAAGRPRRLTEQDIIDRAAGNPARQVKPQP